MIKVVICLASLLIFLTPVVAQNTEEMDSSIKVIESAVEPGVSRFNSVSSDDNNYQAFGLKCLSEKRFELNGIFCTVATQTPNTVNRLKLGK